MIACRKEDVAQDMVMGEAEWGRVPGLLQLDVEGEVGVALKVPSREGTMVTQKGRG